MRALPLDIGTLHFVGIGGIGMSGIAEVLHNLGYSVQGSDIAESPNVRRLRAMGIKVMIGHEADNVAGVAVVVISTAIRPGNPEVDAARAAMLPVVRRAEMLAEIMRLRWSVAVAGTHGKTTTTSLVGQLLDGAGLDPTVINGGIINAYGTNARMGTGDWLVVEADESDGTFTRLPATIGIITNIDPEHLDFWGDFEGIRAAFRRFVDNLPFYGFCALCIDHPEVQALIPDVPDRRVVPYGFSPQADLRGINLVSDTLGQSFDVQLSERMSGDARIIENIRLPMLGRHNVSNALAAIAVAVEMGISDDAIRDALSRFQGVKRRFTRTGTWNGVTIIDDYGHHPVEISAVLKAARAATDDGRNGRVIAVVQPHRYSRLASLFEDFCTCFNDADAVIVADVHAAGEAPIEGADRDALVRGLREHGMKTVAALEAPEALAGLIHELAEPGDFVVCLGAGSITNWANALPEALIAAFPVTSGTRGEAGSQ